MTIAKGEESTWHVLLEWAIHIIDLYIKNGKDTRIAFVTIDSKVNIHFYLDSYMDLNTVRNQIKLAAKCLYIYICILRLKQTAEYVRKYYYRNPVSKENIFNGPGGFFKVYSTAYIYATTWRPYLVHRFDNHFD